MRTIQVEHPIFHIPMEVIPAAELKRQFAPAILPAGWAGPFVHENSLDGAYWLYNRPLMRPMKVLMSACREADGKLWLHVSLSKWNLEGTGQTEPAWSDIKTVKELFIGRDRKALIVLPPAEEYVNMAEVHHLWCCLEGDPTPDFRQGTGSI